MTVKIRPMSAADRPVLLRILNDTPEFKPYEVTIAEDVIDDYLDDGKESGYIIQVAEDNDEVVGYICYGETPVPSAPGTSTGLPLMGSIAGRASARLYRILRKRPSNRQTAARYSSRPLPYLCTKTPGVSTLTAAMKLSAVSRTSTRPMMINLSSKRSYNIYIGFGLIIYR